MNRILLGILVSILASSALLADDHRPCSYRSVAGTYGYATNGVRNGIGDVAGAGVITFHSDGTITGGKQTVSFGGIIADETYDGTYTVNVDCTGSFTVVVDSPIAPRTSHVNVIWLDGTNSVKGIFTDPDTIITADGKRVSSHD